MISKLPGTIIGLKLKLEDSLIGKLPEPLKSEISGLRAAAAGRMKELAGFGMEVLSYLNESIDMSPAASEPKPAKNARKELRKIELE